LLAKDSNPKVFYGYVIVLLCFFILIMTSSVAYTFPVFFQPLLTELGWTRAVTSGAFSVNRLFMALSAVIVGRLTDKLGPRPLVTACGLLLGLGYLLMSQTSAIWQLYLFYGVILAIGNRSGGIPVHATIARWFVKRRGMMTGIVMSGIGICAVVIVPLASRLIANYGWSTSYIILGIIALVITTLAAQFLKRDPSEIRQSPYGADKVTMESSALPARGLSLREATQTRLFWTICAMRFCGMLVISTIMVHIIAYATELRMPATSAANILATIGGVGIIGRIMLGSIGDRISFRSANIICSVLMSAALFVLVAAKEAWMLYLFAVIYGLGQGGRAAIGAPLLAELFGLGSLGAILGGATIASMLGGAIGAVLVGYIFDTTGSYQLAFLGCAVIIVISLILALFIKFMKPISPEGVGG